MLLHHFILVSMIKMRFSLVNDCLQVLEHQQENQSTRNILMDENLSIMRKTQNGMVTFPFLVLAAPSQTNTAPEMRSGQISRLRQAHLHLCEAVDQVNRLFGPCLLSESATMFVSAVHCVHGVVNIATVDYASALFGSDARMLQLVAFFVFTIVLTRVARCSHACHRTSDAAHRTSGPLLRMLPDCAEQGDAAAEKQLRMFLRQMVHVNVHFSAHGLFMLDNRFTFGFISAMFTYCLILVQLK